MILMVNQEARPVSEWSFPYCNLDGRQIGNRNNVIWIMDLKEGTLLDQLFRNNEFTIQTTLQRVIKYKNEPPKVKKNKETKAQRTSTGLHSLLTKSLSPPWQQIF